MDIDKLYKNAEQLQKYADLEGSEGGELLTKLCDLVSGVLDYSSQNFQNAVEKEISDHLAWFQANTRIVTTEREVEVVRSPITELEYIND